MRKAYKDDFLKRHNTKLGFMSAFVKAAAHALTDQPAVNAGTKTTTFKGWMCFVFYCVFARRLSSHAKCVW